MGPNLRSNERDMERTVRHLPLLLALFAGSVQAQTPTWSDAVACIVYSHCTPCHHEDGPGHFSLMSYAEAYPRRADMRDATAIRLMPPWPPDEEYTHLAHERVLTQEEIDIIADWANGGAPEGDAGSAPAPPVYDNEWVITTPDLSVRMEDYVIPASTEDIYRCFVMPSGISADTYLSGFEVIPGNTEVVHHVLVFQDTSGQAQVLDDDDPAPGYTSFGGIGVDGAKLIGFWVPGAQPYFAPAGFGIKLLAGADIVMQVHYPEGSDAQLDSTRINFQTTSGGFIREIGIDAFLEHFLTLTDGPLIIPPNTVQTFHNQFVTPVGVPAIALGIAPHAHLVCTSMKSYAVTPANDTIPLIDIPQWDFAWQGMYGFKNPIYLPPQTELHGEATYDNTSANPNNPNDPPAWVTLGEATTDEMMLFYFVWALGIPNDTNIVIDDTEHTPHHLDCEAVVGMNEMTTEAAANIWPSPARDLLNVEWRLDPARFTLRDASGRAATEVRLTKGVTSVNIGSFARGAYVAEVRGLDGRLLHRSTVVLE